MCKSQWMINCMMLHSSEDNANDNLSVSKSSKSMLAHALLLFLVFNHGFILILFGLFEFILYLFYL